MLCAQSRVIGHTLRLRDVPHRYYTVRVKSNDILADPNSEVVKGGSSLQPCLTTICGTGAHRRAGTGQRPGRPARPPAFS